MTMRDSRSLDAGDPASIQAFLRDVADLVAATSNLRQTLSDIAGQMIDAQLTTAFERSLPATAEVDEQGRLLATDPASGISMYFFSDKPGTESPPHQHTTWLVAIGFAGIEINELFVPWDTRPTTWTSAGTQRLARGQSIVLLPSDAHATMAVGDSDVRHIHIYGRPLTSLSPFASRLIDVALLP